MAKYFFDIFDGTLPLIDQVGQDLPDPQAARFQALSTLPDLARETLPNGNRREFVIDVRDDAGLLVFTATLFLIGRWVGPKHAFLN